MKQIWFFKILINLFFFFNNLDDELILFLCLGELVSTLISPIGSLISLFPCFIYFFILLFTFLPPDTPPPRPRRCQHSVLEVTLFQALWKGFVVVMNACFKITHVLQDVASAALGSALLWGFTGFASPWLCFSLLSAPQDAHPYKGWKHLPFPRWQTLGLPPDHPLQQMGEKKGPQKMILGNPATLGMKLKLDPHLPLQVKWTQGQFKTRIWKLKQWE